MVRFNARFVWRLSECFSITPLWRKGTGRQVHPRPASPTRATCTFHLISSGDMQAEDASQCAPSQPALAWLTWSRVWGSLPPWVFICLTDTLDSLGMHLSFSPPPKLYLNYPLHALYSWHLLSELDTLSLSAMCGFTYLSFNNYLMRPCAQHCLTPGVPWWQAQARSLFFRKICRNDRQWTRKQIYKIFHILIMLQRTQRSWNSRECRGSAGH